MKEFHSIISIKSFSILCRFFSLTLLLHDGTIFSMGATSMLKNFSFRFDYVNIAAELWSKFFYNFYYSRYRNDENFDGNDDKY